MKPDGFPNPVAIFGLFVLTEVIELNVDLKASLMIDRVFW